MTIVLPKPRGQLVLVLLLAACGGCPSGAQQVKDSTVGATPGGSGVNDQEDVATNPCPFWAVPHYQSSATAECGGGAAASVVKQEGKLKGICKSQAGRSVWCEAKPEVIKDMCPHGVARIDQNDNPICVGQPAAQPVDSGDGYVEQPGFDDDEITHEDQKGDNDEKDKKEEP